MLAFARMRLPLSSLAILAALASAPALGDEGRFPECLAQLQAQASQQGIPAELVARTLAQARYEPRSIELDRRQPEFTETLASYLDRRITPQRIEQGQQLLREQRRLLQRVARDYGVQPQYLLAFWGLETNYGKILGAIPVLDSLATLACDERRSAYFTGELMDALRVLGRGIDVQSLVGSWAGAMGNTQFMPSAYLRHAVDADGDGRADIWRSVPDSLASAAAYLKSLGWQSGERWGREVRLPKGFAFELAGLDQTRAISEWRNLGLKDSAGRALAKAEMQASLLVPAGQRGPAFLVYENFRIIMRWNRAESYALSVALLADRIAGSPGLHKPPPADAPRFSREQIVSLQSKLSELGLYSGAVDGIFGSGTRKSIQLWQQSRGLVADGFPDDSVFEALGI
jgi:membrane-bound lytic murein transglycosylase B